jgi:hypothetical protein
MGQRFGPSGTFDLDRQDHWCPSGYLRQNQNVFKAACAASEGHEARLGFPATQGSELSNEGISRSFGESSGLDASKPFQGQYHKYAASRP